VPASAVTLEASNADEGTVMIVDKQFVAREKKVTVGVRSGDQIEIVEGLAEGDTVVVEGNFALPDGTKVEIAKDEDKEGEDDKGKDKDEK
jgi:multidrug efflux pump subunit AcrA (membrane-fusion protein)